MQELDTLIPEPGVATDAMALFLAINTSNVTLLPTEIIALRPARLTSPASCQQRSVVKILADSVKVEQNDKNEILLLAMANLHINFQNYIGVHFNFTPTPIAAPIAANYPTIILIISRP